MSFTLRPALLSDAEAMVEIYMTAFSQDLISQQVFPRSHGSSYEFWLEMLQEEIPDPASHFLVITTPFPSPPKPSPDSTTSSQAKDHLIAFAKWDAPSPFLETPSLPIWPPGSNTQLANHFFGALLQKKQQIMGQSPYWYLELIATRPEWQGHGAAGKLMRWGLQRADREALPVYLEGSPEGVPVYRHFGFREVERFVMRGGVLCAEGDEEFVEVFMVRDARRDEQERVHEAGEE